MANKVPKTYEEFPVSINLSREMIELLDVLKAEYGVASRGRVIEILLKELISNEE